MINPTRIYRSFYNLIRRGTNKVLERYYIYGDTSRPYHKNRVNLIYWKEGQQDNVGDLLSEVIVYELLRREGIDPLKVIKDQRQMAAIGSIIDTLVLPTTVWGSGLRTRGAKPAGVRLDLRAVRGPYTASRLREAGFGTCSVFGDPALLLPLLYTPRVKSVKNEVLIIPHFRRMDMYSLEKNVVSTLTSDWMSFVDDVYNSRLVASSSLHGLVVAEAYGIPTVLLPDLDDDDFKYKDYYSGTGREFDLSFTNVRDILEAPRIPTLVGIGDIQNRLLTAFPYDLWS